MTAPITSNGPITTRLHHYAGRYSFTRLVTACLRLSGISKTLVYQSKHGVLPPLPPNF